MSVDLYRRRMSSQARLYTLLAMLGAFCVVPCAMGRDFVERLSTPIEDPLLAFPPVLRTGAILPGDSGTVPCPVALDSGEPLTLAAAVDFALCGNAQVRVTWATIKQQAAGLGEARSAYLPVINGSVSRTNDRTEYPDLRLDSTNVRATTMYAGLSWRLFDFGGRSANHRAATALLDAAVASHDATIQKVLSSVIGTYFDVERTYSLRKIQEQSVTLAGKTFQAAQRREARGYGSKSDTLQAQAALAKAELATSRARGEFRKAQAALSYTLGLPAQAEVTPAEETEGAVTIDSLGPGLGEWLSQAESNHPAIVAARAQVDAARAKVTATRSEGLPTIDVTGNFYQNGRPNQGVAPSLTRETVIGVTLNIPIFDGFSRSYKVRGAQAAVEQREAELVDVSRQTLSDIVKAHADATVALRNLRASELLLNTARLALSSVQRKFDQGAADIVEMLSSQSVVLDAEQERLRTVVEWHSARLTLLSRAGVLGRGELVMNAFKPQSP